MVAITHKGEADAVSCYDWRTHKRLWSRRLRNNLDAFYGMIESGGRLYDYYTSWPVRQAVLLVLRLADGAVLSERAGDNYLWGAGCPAYDGRYLCYGASHWLHVVDARTLFPQFAFADGGNCYLIRIGRLLIAKGWEHTISAWDMQTQRLVWRIGGPRDVVHCLTRGKRGGWLLIESSSARDVHSGKQVWNTPIYSNSAAGAGDYVYLAGTGPYDSRSPGGQGGFYGVQSATGKLVWSYQKAGLWGYAIMVRAGRVYGFGSDGGLYCFAQN